MEGKTHIAGGIAAGVLVTYVNGSADPTLLIAGAAVGAMVPDICHPQSKIGRKLPIFSFLINKTFGHRTLTHSLLFLLLLAFGAFFIDLPRALEYGFILGALSHMLLDSFTESGIQFLWPFKVKVRFPLYITTGGAIEKLILAGLIAYCGYYGYQIYI